MRLVEKISIQTEMVLGAAGKDSVCRVVRLDCDVW
jgi:hypothetical protein